MQNLYQLVSEDNLDSLPLDAEFEVVFSLRARVHLRFSLFWLLRCCLNVRCVTPSNSLLGQNSWPEGESFSIFTLWLPWAWPSLELTKMGTVKSSSSVLFFNSYCCKRVLGSELWPGGLSARRLDGGCCIGRYPLLSCPLPYKKYSLQVSLQIQRTSKLTAIDELHSQWI